MDEPFESPPLPPGTRLHSFIIGAPLGRGGVGIVYAAEHEILHETFAIKEFLPNDLARRVAGNRVAALPGKEKAYAALRRKFLEEGQTLVQLARPHPHPNLVQVTDAFHENDTVYLCMRFERGQSLDALVESRGPLGESELMALLLPLLDGLEYAHAHRVWHRDIKPSNILVREDGTPLLIDFGAAHRDRADGVVSVIAQYTPNFAASEQVYGGTQGPWTDIYCLAATLYYVVTGHPPPSRLRPGWRSQCPGYSRRFLDALEAGLQFDPERRPETVASWRSLFMASEDDPGLISQRPSDPEEQKTQVLDQDVLIQRPSQGTSGVTTVLSGLEPALGPAAEQRHPQPASRSRRWIWVAGLSVPLLLGGLVVGSLMDHWLNPSPERPTSLSVESSSDIMRFGERLDLAGLECAHVKLFPIGERAIGLSGYLRDAQQLTALLERVRTLAPGLEVERRELAFASPFCDLLGVTNALAPASDRYPGMPIVRFNNPDRIYQEDQYLALDVFNPGAKGGYLYLDFIDSDHQVVHLFPSMALPDNFIPPGSLRQIGARDDAACAREPDACFVISRPHGNNLILALWSETPILPGWRSPQSEPLIGYLAVLRTALDSQPISSSSQRAISYHFFTTTD